MRCLPPVVGALLIAKAVLAPRVAVGQASAPWSEVYPSTGQIGFPHAAPSVEVMPLGDPASAQPMRPQPILPHGARGAIALDVPVEELPPEAVVPSWNSRDYWFGPVPWDTSIELGINGTQATNDALSVRAGAKLDRRTDWNRMDIDVIYNKASANDVETQNNAQFDARHDWLLAESPWSVFASTSLLYDEYQAFDLRFGANGGLGYRLVDTETSTLIGRLGAGTSREFGGPDERWVPEGLFGLEFDHAISQRQKIYGEVDYFPDWEDFTNYRIVTDVGWEILLDEEAHLSLKLSVNDRYDSTPNGADPNLLNYSVLLLWKL